MGKRKGRQRGDDSSSSDASSSDGMSTEETRSTRSSRKTRSKEAKGTKRMFEELKDEMSGMKKETSGMKKEMSGMKKQLKKHNENQIVLCRLLEQLNGSSGDVSPAPRSEPNQMQLPRFRLRITSKVKDKVGKGESILTEHGDPINIVLYDGGNVIANDHPLASASVMMVVLNGEFNKDDIKYNWSKEDFQKSIRRPREGNSATGDVNKIIESTVSGSTFNLAGGSCSHRDAKISENSSNKKVRLGVMVVSQTDERILEGLSNHFLVRDPPKKSKPAPVDDSSTPGNNTYGAHLECLQQPSSHTGTRMDIESGLGDFAAADLEPLWDCPAGGVHSYSTTGFGGLGGFFADSDFVHSSTISDPMSGPLYSPTGSGGLEDISLRRPVQHLDQLMAYSRQPKIHSGDLPTMSLMPEHYDSLTTYLKMKITTIPKEVMQTHRNRGVPIRPHEPDDSDDVSLLKRKLHNKYQLRFVNKQQPSSHTGTGMDIEPEPARVDDSSTPGNNTEQATRSSTPGNNTHGAHLECPQQPSSHTGTWMDIEPGSGRLEDMFLHLDQPMPEHYDSLTTYPKMMNLQITTIPKEVMQTHRNRGVPIRPLEPDDSDDVSLLKRKLHNKYQLRFVNKQQPSSHTGTLMDIEPGFGDFAAASEHIRRRIFKLHSEPLCDWPAGGVHSSTISDRMSGPLYSPTGMAGLRITGAITIPKEVTRPIPPYQRLFLMKMMRNLQITTIPKEVMQTHRNRGVLIQPLEPDDSDDEPLLKRKLHNKYQLRFVNKVCEAYYTLEQIKADDGNLLNVALYDENNSKITSGPLSSASVEVVVLHGDFNANGQDYWTSEEFSSRVVCPQSGKGRSALGGDRVLVLVDGEASVGYAFFQESSFTRTGKFKMGVKMKITIEERIQEGISESFFVTSRRGKDLHPSTMDRVLKDPPAVIPRHAHPVHELKLVTTGGARFLCDGCQEPGCGPRYREREAA